MQNLQTWRAFKFSYNTCRHRLYKRQRVNWKPVLFSAISSIDQLSNPFLKIWRSRLAGAADCEINFGKLPEPAPPICAIFPTYSNYGTRFNCVRLSSCSCGIAQRHIIQYTEENKKEEIHRLRLWGPAKISISLILRSRARDFQEAAAAKCTREERHAV